MPVQMDILDGTRPAEEWGLSPPETEFQGVPPPRLSLRPHVGTG